MPDLPRLKIKLPSSTVAEEICDLEQAKYRFNWGHEPFLILVENETVFSYDDLVKLAQQDRFKSKEFLTVELQPFLAGG